MAAMKRGHPKEMPLSNHKWTIAFDADDTLWHNERGFQMTQSRFANLLADYTETAHLREKLLAAERRNLGVYGFGVKGFVLSMIETAIEVSDGEVPSDVIAELLSMGRAMLADDIEVFDGVRAAIEAVKPESNIILITKGDLIEQERKLAQSGLGDLFDGVEIVSDKTTAIYSHIFAKWDTPQQMMIGNSLRSDVIPAIEAGVWGVHVPHHLTWEYEHAEAPVSHRRFRQINSLSELPQLMNQID